MHIKIQQPSLKRIDRLEDLDVDGNIILKWILKKKGRIHEAHYAVQLCLLGHKVMELRFQKIARILTGRQSSDSLQTTALRSVAYLPRLSNGMHLD
jgi:hypothetical protein